MVGPTCSNSHRMDRHWHSFQLFSKHILKRLNSCKQKPTYRKVDNKPHPGWRGLLSKGRPTCSISHRIDWCCLFCSITFSNYWMELISYKVVEGTLQQSVAFPKYCSNLIPCKLSDKTWSSDKLGHSINSKKLQSSLLSITIENEWNGHVQLVAIRRNDCEGIIHGPLCFCKLKCCV